MTVQAGGPETNEAFLAAVQALEGLTYNDAIADALIAAWRPEYGDPADIGTRVYNARRELRARADRAAIQRFNLRPGAMFRRLTTRGMFGENQYSRVTIQEIWRDTIRGECYRKGGRTPLTFEIDPRNIVAVDPAPESEIIRAAQVPTA